MAGRPPLPPIYIAGVAETPLGKVLDHTENSMVALAAHEALAEAGMSLRDVDALFVNYMGEEGSVQVGEYLGIQPRYADSSDMGGGSFEAFVHHAMIAIASGRCEVALICYASRQRSLQNRKRAVSADDLSIAGQFEAPFGIHFPIGYYALTAARHMHQYGTKPEQLAEVAVAARRWAQLNPKAWARGHLSIDDVLSSPMISDPLHKLDCCLVTDGGRRRGDQRHAGEGCEQAARARAGGGRKPSAMAYLADARPDGDAWRLLGPGSLRHGRRHAGRSRCLPAV